MQTELIVGYDPGGNGAHGLAELEVADFGILRMTTRTLQTTEEVVSQLEGLSSLAALGVDTLSCWATGEGAWRPADRWLRERYKPVQKSVISPNGLFGAMCLNGMAVLIAVRRRFPDLFITETHPKVLHWHLFGEKYDYERQKARMETNASNVLGVPLKTANGHEWDAAISAYAALAGRTGQWQHDLHGLPGEPNERLVKPCGDTHYCWPE